MRRHTADPVNTDRLQETTMQDWQQRVVDEKADLDRKIERLLQFFQGAAYQGLEQYDQSLLRNQHMHMSNYSQTLAARISRFQ